MDPESCNNINQLWATLLIEELVRNGITRFVLSPGSRSTPLTTAVAQHPKTNNTVHYDERGAAFYALGHAKATGNPTALLCTSGTATANYLPAIIEASESRIPLIVLTADRPPELLDCEANQAIDQQDLYKNYTRWATTLPCPDPAIDPAVLLTTVDQAVYRAQRAPRGPVHLNCMFREPLAPTPDASIPNAYCDTLTQWTNTDAPYTQYHLPKVSLFTEEQGAFIQTITNAQRGWLVVGELTSEAETEAAQALANALQWPVFPEVTSGLRLTTGAPAPVLHYDAILRNFDSDDRPTPDLVLHIGGPLVSKELPAFISSHR
jgi:2-succinyl-5-enolpyruvyl-6-hydroxy-3-cyclohexene-1-carboxylate synthase